ncbi:hypothetical protein DsansV1_C02g0020261 [Dioscorea sansibarensis]
MCSTTILKLFLLWAMLHSHRILKLLPMVHQNGTKRKLSCHYEICQHRKQDLYILMPILKEPACLRMAFQKMYTLNQIICTFDLLRSTHLKILTLFFHACNIGSVRSPVEGTLIYVICRCCQMLKSVTLYEEIWRLTCCNTISKRAGEHIVVGLVKWHKPICWNSWPTSSTLVMIPNGRGGKARDMHRPDYALCACAVMDGPHCIQSHHYHDIYQAFSHIP